MRERTKGANLASRSETREEKEKIGDVGKGEKDEIVPLTQFNKFRRIEKMKRPFDMKR